MGMNDEWVNISQYIQVGAYILVADGVPYTPKWSLNIIESNAQIPKRVQVK